MGEKVAFYFALFGFYNQMLIPAALVGLIIFIYGAASVANDQPTYVLNTGSKEIIHTLILDRIFVEIMDKIHTCVQDVIKHVHFGNLVIVVYTQK